MNTLCSGSSQTTHKSGLERFFSLGSLLFRGPTKRKGNFNLAFLVKDPLLKGFAAAVVGFPMGQPGILPGVRVVGLNSVDTVFFVKRFMADVAF